MQCFGMSLCQLFSCIAAVVYFRKKPALFILSSWTDVQEKHVKSSIFQLNAPCLPYCVDPVPLPCYVSSCPKSPLHWIFLQTCTLYYVCCSVILCKRSIKVHCLTCSTFEHSFVHRIQWGCKVESKWFLEAIDSLKIPRLFEHVRLTEADKK